MNIKCIIVDDEPLGIQIIENHIAQIPEMTLVQTFQNPLAAFEFLQKNMVDLLFLDIQMPLLTGIDLLKSLQQPPSVIFTTAYRHYAIESYELDVIDYLLKPITFTRFFRAVNKYKQIATVHTPELLQKSPIIHDHLYVNVNKRYVKILFNEILYVESIKDYVRIHTAEKQWMTKDKISQFEKKLPAQFLRIHRSFIVNVSKVTAFTAKDIEIGRKELPIGESYKKNVIGFLKQV